MTENTRRVNTRPQPPWASRFWKKATRGKSRPPSRPDEPSLLTPCLTWNGATDNKGYGLFRAPIGFLGVSTGVTRAHRIAFWIFFGPFPVRAQIDHKCRNRKCIEPTHLKLLGPVEHAKISNIDKKRGD